MALDFFAGCVGGFAGVIVGHPFDTVKVRLQTQSAKNPHYRGTFHCFSSIVKQESAYGLYKGVMSPMYGLMAINAIVFGVQGNVQRRMRDPDRLSSHFIAGSIAGTIQCLVCSPMELAKTRMQTQGQGSKAKSKKLRYKGPVDCLKQIYIQQGIRGVYRGMGLTVAREAPAFGMYFLSYEYLCRLFENADGSQLSTIPLLVAGGSAGMVSWFVTYPADVLKSRVQNDAQGHYKGMLDCARKSIAEEGYRCFTRGLSATMVRAFPVNAATFYAVTVTMRFVHKYQKQQEEEGGHVLLSQLPQFEKHQWQHHAHVDDTEVPTIPIHP